MLESGMSIMAEAQSEAFGQSSVQSAIRSDLVARMDALNQGIFESAVLDFSVQSYSGGELVIVGSFDLAYYQDLQIEFSRVSFFSCPMRFSDASFRCLDRSEWSPALIESCAHAITDEDTVFAVELSRFYDVQTHYIVAGSCSYRFSKQYYEAVG